MKHAKTALLWIGCVAFTLAYGAFVGYSLDEQIQTENAVYLTANR